MYQPEEFREHDEEWALSHISRHPFGILFGRAEDGYAAGHFPFQLARLTPDGTPAGLEHGDGALVIEGHGAIRNTLLATLPEGAEVLLVFSGPSAYVTPGIYRAEPDVPTWNYTTVHVRGRYHRLPAEATPRLLERTVQHNEQGPLGSGWSTRSMAPSDLESLARGVASFWIRIDRIEAARKLSQDKLREDAIRVESSLAEHSGEASEVAAEMRETGLLGRASPPTTDPAVWMADLG